MCPHVFTAGSKARAQNHRLNVVVVVNMFLRQRQIKLSSFKFNCINLECVQYSITITIRCDLLAHMQQQTSRCSVTPVWAEEPGFEPLAASKV